MLEILDGFPDGVIAVAAKGRVSAEDYDKTLIPLVEKALQRHRKVRIYYELGRGFTGIEAGAALKDFWVGVEHLTRWERIAVVADIEWIRHTMQLFRFLMPGQVRVFATHDAKKARAWILELDTPQ